MKAIRMTWLWMAGFGGLGLTNTWAAPPEPLAPGQTLWAVTQAPLQILTETQAILRPGTEVTVELVQESWLWVTVRGWVRSNYVHLPEGGFLQSGQVLISRVEAPLQVESETRAMVLPNRKLQFEQAQGDWLWVAVQGWCQARYLAKEPPALWQVAPPVAEYPWQYQLEPSRSYYYYYYDYSSPYRYRSYPPYHYYYYDRYGPGYGRYWSRTWIDIDIHPPRPSDRPPHPPRPPEGHRPPEWHRPPGRPDSPPHHLPGKSDPSPKPGKPSLPSPKLPKMGSAQPKPKPTALENGSPFRMPENRSERTGLSEGFRSSASKMANGPGSADSPRHKIQSFQPSPKERLQQIAPRAKSPK